MPYSLVSAATLGFDLVRLPAGRSVAAVLLAGLGADARRRSPPSPPSTPAAAWPATSAACSPSAPARPASWPPAVPHMRGAARGPRRVTARRSSSPSSSAAPSATPPRSSGSLRDDVLGPEHPARGLPHRRRLGRGRRRARRRRPRALGRRRAAPARPPRAHRPLRPASSTAVPVAPRRWTPPSPSSSTPSATWTPPAGPPGAPPWTRAVPTTAPGPPRCTRPPGPRTSPGAPAIARHRAAARRPGVPRRRLRPARRCRRCLERARRLRAGHGRWPTCSTRRRSPSSRRPGSASAAA